MTDIPENPAAALQQLFLRARQSGGNSIMAVWARVLHANPGTPEFAVRHAEVVFLVRRLELYIRSLPEDDAARMLYESDIPAWYNAVSHTGNWTTASDAHANMIEDDKIRLLGSLGQILTLRAQTEEEPSDKPDLDVLKSSLAKWEALLDGADLPLSLVAKIRAQLELIHFLLDEVESFGLESIAEHGRTLFGLGLSVIKVAGKAGSVVSAMSGLFEFITQVSVSDYGQAANTLAGLFSSVSDVFTLAAEEENQKALIAKEQKQLTTKKADDSEVIEGEVVETSESPTPENGT